MRTTLLALWPVGLALLALLCTVRSMTAAEFPAVDQLPAHAELPDPLRMLNGERVTTKEDWVGKRRPELKALFQHYMYGELPPAPEKITAIVEREDRKYFDGKATKKELAITIGPGDMPKIYLLLVVPNKRKGPAPAFVGMNFHGNHALVNDPTVPHSDGVDVCRQRGEGQPCHRGGPGRGNRRLGPGAIDRPRLRRGDVLLRRHRPGSGRQT